jgi:hypothetical protein
MSMTNEDVPLFKGQWQNPGAQSGKTFDPLGGSFGSDRQRRLIVSLDIGDVITLRPEGTDRVETLRAVDVYRWAIQCRVMSARLEKARESKKKKAILRERRALKYQEKKLLAPIE